MEFQEDSGSLRRQGVGELGQLRKTERRALHPGNMAESHIPLISIDFLWEILSMKSMLRVKKTNKTNDFSLEFPGNNE